MIKMPYLPAMEITPSVKTTTSGTSKRPSIIRFISCILEFDSTKIRSPKLERLHFYLSHIKNLWGNCFE